MNARWSLALSLLVLTGSVAAAAVTAPGFATLPREAAFVDVAPAASPKAAARPHAHEIPDLEGEVPDLTTALTRLDRRERIVVRGDDGWTPAAGIRGGSGTPQDPFLIEGYHVDTILIADTSKPFVIRGNYVAGILILDWTGPGGLVHHNHLANFRTNRNVERTGDPTSAVVAENEIRRVEELRHFDGALVNNTIGDPDALLARGVALNVAGLNGARIRHNVIHGGVDMKLHGHHHSDETGAHSHNHGQPDADQPMEATENHSRRFVNFEFRENRIVDRGFGLRYNDLNHAGDDRTATSEQEPTLEDPHYHFTTVRIADNVVEGARLRFAAFNAPDERHLGEWGRIVVENNTVLPSGSGDGIVLQDVAFADVLLHGNRVERAKSLLGLPLGEGGAGIALLRFSNSAVTLEANGGSGYGIGVRARELDEHTVWRVVGNAFESARYPVYWDESVANPPEGDAPAAEREHAHDHGSHGDDASATAAPPLAARPELPVEL